MCQVKNTFLSEVTTRENLTCPDLFYLCFHFTHRWHPTVITPSFKYQRAPSRVRSISTNLSSGPTVSPGKCVPKERSFPLKWAEIFLLSSFSLSTLTSWITQHPQTYGADFVLSPQPHGDWKGAFTRTMPCMFCDIRIALHSNWHHNTPSLLLFYNW